MGDVSSIALAPAPTLAALGVGPREGIDRLASSSIRAVQLSIAQAGMRPRDLDRSARRDLLATLRRRELIAAGVDAWIPVAHYADPTTSDRAADALLGAIDLASDLGRIPVSTTLPDDDASRAIVDAVIERAVARDIRIADHGAEAQTSEGIVGIGVDPAALLTRDEDPAAAVATAGAKLVSARLVDLLRTGMRGAPGDPHDGQLDVMSYRVALEVSAYSRPVVVDLRQWREPWAGLARTVAVWG